ncbi:MAG: hypothetical protein IRY99_06500 [Isosphaeraceae bacterium]|nr:hypothetical protein [Isosphaeraceae bacterium]
MQDRDDPAGGEAEEPFGELLTYTVAGYAGGLVVAAVLDWLGFKRNPIGQWIVRTLSGEGESIFEGIFAIRRRLSGAGASMAEAYGWGKLLGMIVPWIIDLGSRLAGVDIYGAEGFYIPFFYALSDQIGASIMGFVHLARREGTWRSTVSRYFRTPVMVASFIVVMLVPIGLLIARLLGFSPTTQVYTAIETILANLCWVPPLAGWLAERRERVD